MPFNVIDRQYWDVPTRPDQQESILVRHYNALENSVTNLLRTPVGERGGLFRPLWGSRLHRYLHEPLDELTMLMIKMELHYTLRKHFPLITVNLAKTDVSEIPEGAGGPGIRIRLAIDTRVYDGLQVSRTFQVDIQALGGE